MKILPWKQDSFVSLQGSYFKYDKLEHLFIAFILVAVLFQLTLLFDVHWSQAPVLTFLTGTVWEVKDGIVPYDERGNIQGYSHKDQVANVVGNLLGTLMSLHMSNII